MTTEEIIARLPKSGDGVPLVPGMDVRLIYLGSEWTARVVNVGDDTIDIQYTNEATHAAKGAVSRLRKPSEWFVGTIPPETPIQPPPAQRAASGDD